MSIILSVLTDRSCGEACWHAKEVTCRCECGGVNHGILLKEGTTQPNRHSKIDGSAYELVSVGSYNDMTSKFNELIKPFNPKCTRNFGTDEKPAIMEYKWDYTDLHAPYRVKPASKAQCVLWAELSAYKGLSNFEFYQNKPYLLWRKYN